MAWPTIVDDDGDGVSGTIFCKALTDAMKVYIDAGDGGGGAVDWSAAAVAIAIKDNEAAAVNFLEGASSYLKLITTNDAECVALGQKVTIVDDSTASYDMLTLTPGGAMAVNTIWRGLYINGAALDPSGASVQIEGICVDLSGVGVTNLPEIAAICVHVPVGETAIHVDEQVHVNMDISSLVAGQHRTGIDIVVDGVGSTGGEMHGYDIATVGAGSATVVGYSTHGAIDVIHQHVGVFVAADKCWRYVAIGTTYTDATTAFGSAGTDLAIFQADNDIIYIGDAAVFDEIEVILATAASVNLKVTFEFSLASGWTTFYPSDDTNGFSQDGAIRFEHAGLTNWAAQTVNGSSQYYIRITRTKNNVVTSPTEDTIKILDATVYYWNKTGALNVLSVGAPTAVIGAAGLTVGVTTPSAAQWAMLGAAVEWTDWTPTLTGGADLSGYDVARYFRLGKICFFYFNAEAKNVTSAGTIQITLPFTSAATNDRTFAVQVHDGTAWIGHVHGAILADNNYFTIQKTEAAGVWAGTETGVYIRCKWIF